MTNLEIALTNLGEATAVEFHKKNDSVGISELKDDMNKFGKVLKKAKEEIEKELERPVVTNINYLDLTKNDNFIENK